MIATLTRTSPVRAGVARRPLVDWASPLYVVGYLVLTFGPFREVIDPPGIVISGLIPLAGVGLLLITPTDRIMTMPICLPLIAYVGWNVASYIWTDVPTATFFMLRSEFSPLLVMTAVAATIDRDVLVRSVLSFFLIISGWNVLASVLYPGTGMLAGGGFAAGIHGTIGHKNDLGIFAVMTLAMVLPLYRGPWRRTIVFILVATALATRSATAGGGLATVAFVWFLMMAVSRGRSRRDRQILKAAAAALAIIAVLMTLRLMPVALDVYDKDLTFSGRTMIWTESLRAVAQEPWLGRGLGGVWTQAPTMLRIELWHQIGFPAAHSHNGAIQLMLDIGIIGLGLMIVFLLSIARLAVKASLRPETRDLGRWGVLVLATTIVTGFAEPMLGVPQIGLLSILWVVLAAANNERFGSRHSPSPTAF